MEKISGILPGSSRVTAVDLKEAGPVRPGTPSFGRPQGVSSLKEVSRDSIFPTSQKAINSHNELNDWRSKDAKLAAVAAELSDRFFIRNQKEAELPVGPEASGFNMSQIRATAQEVASSPAGFKTDGTGSLRAAQASFSRPSTFDDFDDSSTTLAQPEGLYPKGSFIDRTA